MELIDSIHLQKLSNRHGKESTTEKKKGEHCTTDNYLWFAEVKKKKKKQFSCHEPVEIHRFRGILQRCRKDELSVDMA